MSNLKSLLLPFLFSATLLLGNLYRLPVGDGGVTGLDILTGIMAFFGFFTLCLNHKKIPSSSIWLPILGFVSIAVLSTLWGIAVWGFDTGPVLYLVRLSAYLMILPVTSLWLAKDDTSTKTLIISYTVFFTALGLSILGFIQLYLFPDFGSMEILGWDPHEGRLLSTWFDPNFIGAFLALTGTILLAIVLKPRDQNRHRILSTLVLLVILVALALTFSRSAWLSFLIGAGIITMIRSGKTLLLGLVIIATAISLSPRAQERLLGAIAIDKTASYRIESWQNSLDLWQNSPWLGVGYNYLRPLQDQAGFVEGEEVHSASGSDSSFLTILATTGIFGAIFWLLFFLEILALSWQRFKNRKDMLALGIFAGSIALFVDSWFVNSLLFPFILAPWLVLVAIIIAQPPKPLTKAKHTVNL